MVQQRASFIRFKRYDEALVCYGKVLELDPQNLETWHNKGNVLTKMERFDEALVCYGKALELDPQNLDTGYSKGSVLTKMERFRLL